MPGLNAGFGSDPAMGRKRKADAQRRHAYSRGLLRYDIELTDELHKRLVRAVQRNETTPVEKQSNRVSVHELDIDGEPVRFVYDRLRKTVVTFLHRDPSKYLEVG